MEFLDPNLIVMLYAGPAVLYETRHGSNMAQGHNKRAGLFGPGRPSKVKIVSSHYSRAKGSLSDGLWLGKQAAAAGPMIHLVCRWDDPWADMKDWKVSFWVSTSSFDNMELSYVFSFGSWPPIGIGTRPQTPRTSLANFDGPGDQV
jgi:hypothetical protein